MQVEMSSRGSCRRRRRTRAQPPASRGRAAVDQAAAARGISATCTSMPPSASARRSAAWRTTAGAARGTPGSSRRRWTTYRSAAHGEVLAAASSGTSRTSSVDLPLSAHPGQVRGAVAALPFTSSTLSSSSASGRTFPRPLSRASLHRRRGSRAGCSEGRRAAPPESGYSQHEPVARHGRRRDRSASSDTPTSGRATVTFSLTAERIAVAGGGRHLEIRRPRPGSRG